MKPKEKAIEITNQFDIKIKDCTKGVSIKELSKECAMISIELALEFCDGSNLDDIFDKTLYLIEVKNEIEKL